MDSETKNNWSNGRPLREQARQIVFNVTMFLKIQKLKYNLNYDILESTSAATGVPICMIKNVLREHKLLTNRNAPASLKHQNDTRKEEKEKTVIKEEANIKQEQSDDNYGLHPSDTTFVAVKVEPEFFKAEMKDVETIKQEPHSQLDENRVWNTECAEAASDSAECKIVNTASEIVPKHEEDTSNHNPSIQCNVCGKIFTCSNRLITHRRMHFRVIKCDTCGKSYKILRSAKLSSGEEVHVCKASDEHHMQKHNLYVDKDSYLKTLQERINNNKPHKCEFCGKSYKREHDLKLHTFAHRRK